MRVFSILCTYISERLFKPHFQTNRKGGFKRYVRYRKAGRTRQAAGAGKHPPETAARHLWTERRVYAAVRGLDAGGYVLVAVISFAAAAVITALCIRLRIRENKNQGGTGKPVPQEQEGEKK